MVHGRGPIGEVGAQPPTAKVVEFWNMLHGVGARRAGGPAVGSVGRPQLVFVVPGDRRRPEQRSEDQRDRSSRQSGVAGSGPSSGSSRSMKRLARRPSITGARPGRTDD